MEYTSAKRYPKPWQDSLPDRGHVLANQVGEGGGAAQPLPHESGTWYKVVLENKATM